MASRQRARQLGIAPGVLPVGEWNAITDVRGLKVGHVTVIEGEEIRTGVTAILPHAGNLFQEKVPAARVFSGQPCIKPLAIELCRLVGRYDRGRLAR